MDVSIIIVNYNTKELTRNCLKSVFDQTKNISFEVIVSDNGSNDGSVEMIKSEFPKVILIENNANLGFGAANNRGLKIAKGKYIFYLNSDTLLLNNAVKFFFDYWENSPEKEKIGALGCNLENKNGEILHSYGVFPNFKNIFCSLFHCVLAQIGIKKIISVFYKNIGNIRPYFGNVDYITGADNFLLNNQFAYFDERFFMYFEESDLQFNLKKHKFYRSLIKGPKIVHLEGASSKEKKEKKNIYNFAKKSSAFYWLSCYKYAEKNLCNKEKLMQLKKILQFLYSLPKNRNFKFILEEIF